MADETTDVLTRASSDCCSPWDDMIFTTWRVYQILPSNFDWCRNTYYITQGHHHKDEPAYWPKSEDSAMKELAQWVEPKVTWLRNFRIWKQEQCSCTAMVICSFNLGICDAKSILGYEECLGYNAQDNQANQVFPTEWWYLPQLKERHGAANSTPGTRLLCLTRLTDCTSSISYQHPEQSPAESPASCFRPNTRQWKQR